MYREYGFFQRLTKIEEEFPGANVILHKLGKIPQVILNDIQFIKILFGKYQLNGKTFNSNE